MSIEIFRRVKQLEAEVVSLKDRLAKVEAARENAEKRPTLRLAKKAD